MTEILMPALSPTMEEGVLAKWNIKVGDTVKAGDVIAEIETDKATMEVEAVDEGVVEKILVQAGATGVKVNTPIALLKGEGEETPAASPPAPVPTPPPTAAQPAPPPKGTDDVKATESPTPTAAAPASTPERVFATPLARRVAEQAGVDLATIKGSGPHGRIIEADVATAKPAPAAAPAKPAAQPAPAPAAAAAAPAGAAAKPSYLEMLGVPNGTYDLVPLDMMRKVIAKRMTESFRDVPHFPLTVELEIDRLLDARVRVNATLEKQGVKVSVNDLVIKAAAMALKAVPQANASYTPEGFALHHNADIAVAVALDNGLITPIVRKAETKSLSAIATEMKDLAKRARDKKLKPEEFQGGTFSISNLGMFGVKSFASIINQPQGAIMSVGAGVRQPVARGDKLEIATVMSVTLTCDHRVVDGAVGARFLQAFKGFVDDPVTMLA